MDMMTTTIHEGRAHTSCGRSSSVTDVPATVTDYAMPYWLEEQAQRLYARGPIESITTETRDGIRFVTTWTES